jgi:sulfatase maturation enzyme AslB (radical SAM superfamily)
MKWINKGHEFDEMYEKISQKESFYLFGAGDYGKHFCKFFNDEIHILGYIDNDTKKQGTYINNLKCWALDEITLENNIGIILTMSQISRIAPVEQLASVGYKKGVDYFIIDEFISVYHVYKHNKVYFSSISFLPSTTCNLKCKHCLNFNPFAKKFYVRELEKLIEDVDLFFSCVDNIMRFHVSGGEPMLDRKSVV